MVECEQKIARVHARPGMLNNLMESIMARAVLAEAVLSNVFYDIEHTKHIRKRVLSLAGSF